MVRAPSWEVPATTTPVDHRRNLRPFERKTVEVLVCWPPPVHTPHGRADVVESINLSPLGRPAVLRPGPQPVREKRVAAVRPEQVEEHLLLFRRHGQRRRIAQDGREGEQPVVREREREARVELTEPSGERGVGRLSVRLGRRHRHRARFGIAAGTCQGPVGGAVLDVFAVGQGGVSGSGRERSGGAAFR